MKKISQRKPSGLDETLAAIELDETALGATTQWQQVESDRDTYLVACANLPELQQQLRLCEHETAGCLQKLDRADIGQPASLLLKTATQANLRELIQQQPALLAQIQAASHELTTATDQYDEHLERYLQGRRHT